MRDWESKKEKLEKIINKIIRYRLKGNNNLLLKKRTGINARINFNNKLGISMTTSLIIIKLCELVPKMKNRPLYCLCK